MIFVFAVLVAIGCGNREKDSSTHDYGSEHMLEGIWMDSEDESVAFRIFADSLYYPAENVLPAHYRISADTLYIDGATHVKYAIVHLSDNIFQFKKADGEVVKLVKTNSKEAVEAFNPKKDPVQVVQQLQKRDTVVVSGDMRYHCYMQVNPTTYQVVIPEYNDAIGGAGKVYYDNIVHLAVYNGAQKLFSSDFRKHDFDKYVPAEIMQQSVLSDIVYVSSSQQGVVFQAQICIPESAVSYLVDINISKEGVKKLSQR